MKGERGEWTGPDEFMEIYGNSQVKKELQEYIAAEISVQVQETLYRIFGPAEDLRRAKGEKRCLVCGISIKEIRSNRQMYCHAHHDKNARARLALAGWGFMVERLWPLTTQIIDKMKEEGKWPE